MSLLTAKMLLDLTESQEQEEILSESTAPRTSKQNLESKIESLIRSIRNLSEKQMRLEFELKRQKKSLARKREELKRVSKTTQIKGNLSLEGSVLESQNQETRTDDIKRTQSLLQESARILEEE